MTEREKLEAAQGRAYSRWFSAHVALDRAKIEKRNATAVVSCARAALDRYDRALSSPSPERDT